MTFDKVKIKNLEELIDVKTILEFLKESSNYKEDTSLRNEESDLKFYHFIRIEDGQYGLEYKLEVTIYNNQMIHITFENVDNEIQSRIISIMKDHGYKSYKIKD